MKRNSQLFDSMVSPLPDRHFMDGQIKNRTVLVVEDEAPLLVLLKRILESDGYAVLTAQDGVEAVQVYRQQQRGIDLVFCDMALPKLGGWTVFLSLREIRPDVKIVLASGYLDPRVRFDMIREGAQDFITKPYMPDGVLATIRRVFEERIQA
jgi:CheY-like chemotaxis protein